MSIAASERAGRIPSGNDNGGVAYDLGKSAGVAHHEGPARGKCFDGGETERFGETRQDHEIARREQLRHVEALAQQRHVCTQAAGFDLCLEGTARDPFAGEEGRIGPTAARYVGKASRRTPWPFSS